MVIVFFKKVEVFWYKILYFFSFIIFILFVLISKTNSRFIFEFCLLELNSICFTIPVLLDPVSLSFRCVMLFIRGSVIFFSRYYMLGEKYINRFSVLILLFILSINLLIFIPNLISLLLGWDGLGIVSFLLVIFYQNTKSLGSGLITFLSNRVGDALLIVSIGWIVSFGSWNIFYVCEFKGFLLVLWCVVIASITKRAQIPFSAWLPAAMAAPTPVSALVHSSTLVTAGVYLLIRFHDQVFSIPGLRWYVLHISTLTTLIAGIRAVCETDLKKIIALSTLRQLGVMIFSLRLGLKELCIFHLFTHALFKALLFICAGSIIHSHHHLQDVRKLGSAWYFMPVSATCLNVANLSLCGFPFLSGFYSKDFILESMLEGSITIPLLVLIVIATFLTTLYSTRLTFLRLVNKNNFFPIRRKSEETKENLVPIVIITMVSIFSGSSLFWSMNSELIEPWVGIFEKLFPLILVLRAIAVTIVLQDINFFKKRKIKLMYSCSNIWFLAPLRTQPLVANFFYISENNIKVVDQGWNEILGGQGLFKLSRNLMSKIGGLQINTSNIFVGLFIMNFIVILIYF